MTTKNDLHKILLDARQTMGGVERYTCELANLALKGEHRSRFVFYGRQTIERFMPVSPRRTAGGFLRRRLGNTKRILTDQVLLPFAAHQTEAGLIHSPNYLVPFLTRKPVVVTCHDISLVDHFPTKQAGIMRYYERAVMRHGLSKAAHIIVPSRAVASRLMERFRLSSHTISVIYPPLPSFCFAKLNGRENPQGLPFAGQGPFFLSVGTLEPRKNLQRLIQGWRQTYTQCRIPLLLVGPYGWKEKKLKDGQSTVSDGLHWLGPVDDSTLTALYRQATAVIQYSLDEGFDYPVAEALCMGTPLIVSDIEVHREVTAGCALFAPPTAPEILAERLFELCSWPQEKKSECKMQARRQADLLRKFSAIDNYLTLYDRVLAAEE